MSNERKWRRGDQARITRRTAIGGGEYIDEGEQVDVLEPANSKGEVRVQWGVEDPLVPVANLGVA